MNDPHSADWAVFKMLVAWVGVITLNNVALFLTCIFCCLQIYKIWRDIMKDRAKERAGLEPPPTKPAAL